MFSRTVMAMARTRPPFAMFYKSIAPALVRTSGPRRMKVAGALWSSTTPKFGVRMTQGRADQALQQYSKFGNGVIARAKRGSAAGKRKTAAASKKSNSKAKKINRKKKSAVTSRPKTSSAARRTKPISLSAFQRAVRKGQHMAIAPRQKSVIRALYTATAPLPSVAKRVTVSRQILKLLSKAEPPKKTSKRSSHRRTVRRSKRRTPRRAARRRSAKASNSLEVFRAKVMKQAKLSSSKATNDRVHRLWMVTNSMPHLSMAKRVDMAVRLIQKTKNASHKHTRKSPSAKGSHRKSPVRRHRKNPYLNFYRAMVLTGEVPNHPRGARSKRIKELWTATSHLKTLKARIRHGEAILTGAESAPSAASVVAKPAASRVKAAAKRTRLPTVSAVKPIRFRVPQNYEQNPFAYTYSVLGKYAHGADSDARMHTVAKAWLDTLPSGRETRSPRARIQAVADVLKRSA